MFLFVAGLLAGLIVGSVVYRYWEDIKLWLNTTAADVVEERFGYEARKNIFKAISVVDKVFRRINGRLAAINTTTTFSRLSNNSYAKTEMTHYEHADRLGDEFLEDIKNGNDVMELDYR